MKGVIVYKNPQVQVVHDVLDPGEEIPWHFHTVVGDTFYVVRGALTVFTSEPDAKVALSPGNTFTVPSRQPHRVFNGSDQPAEFLLILGIGAHDFNRVQPAPELNLAD